MAESTAIDSVKAMGQEIDRQRGYLSSESYEIRKALEHITDPTLQWIWDVLVWLETIQPHPKVAEFIKRIKKIDGLLLDNREHCVQIEFNVEREMDARTSQAMAVLVQQADALETTIQADPLVSASNNPQTKPVVDVLRTLAESLG